MEAIIDAVKKRAWRSAWLALWGAVVGLFWWVFSNVKSALKTLAFLYLCGFALGFGGWFGLSSALRLDDVLDMVPFVFAEW
ncbi:hypothetical protein ACSTIX_10425 [Vibrio parahaemolyticus]|nr:hypothetical protein [Vibrio parahaemolyticus]